MKSAATLITVFITFFSPFTVLADVTKSAPATGEQPFVLIARLHALPNAVEDVLRLLHTFDQDPRDPLGFVWTEVYADSDALVFHLENPPLQKYLTAVSPLLDGFTVELYGEVSARAVNMLRATGTPTSHFQSKFGYVRELAP